MKPFDRPIAIALASAFSIAGASAHAANVVGGSDLLNAASANQLEAWLGQGAIELTNIFDKAANSTGQHFHAAADGQGATFTLIEVLGDNRGRFDAPILVGGYNPQSWDSSGNYHITVSDAERTGFIFNLTQGVKLNQRTTSSAYNFAGQYQTFNHASYGPTFGGGHDLYVDFALTSGYSYLYSYGQSDADLFRTLPTYPDPYPGYGLVYGQIEVFTIAPAQAVPEPETYALMLAGLAATGWVARRRQPG